MAKARLTIKELRRSPEQAGAIDSLSLQPGVNVLVGPPNTGKSQWLEMLDLLLGRSKPITDVLSEDVLDAYDSVHAVVTVGGQELELERRLNEPGLMRKVIVDGEPKSFSEFSHLMYDLLGIPLVHYPQGNPYGPRTWPELSWRSLMRHAYRRWRFWSDLADKQPDSEQHACLLQFLGLARELFSAEYGRLVDKEKELQATRLQRESFLRMLQEVSQDLVDEEDLGVALTDESLDRLIAEIEGAIEELLDDQDRRLSALRDAAAEAVGEEDEVVGRLVEQLANDRASEERLAEALEVVKERHQRASEYRQLLVEEVERMGRAEEASKALSTIQITHCPACDVELEPRRLGGESCFLCHRPLASAYGGERVAQKRLEFERSRLSAELAEAETLLGSIRGERESLEAELGRARERVRSVQAQLEPVRRGAAGILPADVGLAHMEMGRMHQRLAQVKRVRASLKKREKLSEEIDRLGKQIADLTNEVKKQRAELDYVEPSEALADGMNSYLNRIRKTRENLWAQKDVRMLLNDRGFDFHVGDRSWRSKLGGTSTLFFLIAYHYGLLSLSGTPGRHYPGFLVLDFPAELDDGTRVRDQENFVLEPFVELLAEDSEAAGQVIAAGSSFEGLVGANRVEFTRVWR